MLGIACVLCNQPGRLNAECVCCLPCTSLMRIHESSNESTPNSAITCRTAQAFTRCLGVLGVNLQAERMLHAFVSRGLELRLQEIKYHAQGKDNEVESLTGICSEDSDAEASHKYMLFFLVTVEGSCGLMQRLLHATARVSGLQTQHCEVLTGVECSCVGPSIMHATVYDDQAVESDCMAGCRL